jgi:sec-independent protein translocase protein TatA
MAHLPLAFIGNLKGIDLLVIVFFALLIFGRRLPEIGKNIGRSVVEFKKGLKAGAANTTQEEVEEEPEQVEEAPPRKKIPAKAAKRVRASSDEP